MRMIEIKSLPNGAHRNQSVFGKIVPPAGWAAIPDRMRCENFPFGDVEVEEVNGVVTVTSWTPREIPTPVEPETSPAQLREEAYNTDPCIDWEGGTLTVTQAAQKWSYYAAEGSDKAEKLQSKIAEAKAEIRAKYPDEEAS